MPVSLLPVPDHPGPLATTALVDSPGDVSDALDLAIVLGELIRSLGEVAPVSSRDLWETLATIAARDLGAARAVEPHLDAMGILTQAGASAAEGTWGVFASEGGDAPVVASLADDSWTLTGTKQWCSLADRLDSALVTATLDDDSRALFAVRLDDPGVSVEPDRWVARGLTEIPSGPVRFDGVPAEPIGEPGWYLSRPGFAWGGIGVAACWFGGAVGVARTVFAAATAKPNPFIDAHLGAIDELLQSSRAVLLEASELADDGSPDGRIIAKRVRATVARSCEEIIARAGHALGPAPLALDAEHTKRVADLQLYIRQHHAERDQASLGESLRRGELPW